MGIDAQMHGLAAALHGSSCTIRKRQWQHKNTCTHKCTAKKELLQGSVEVPSLRSQITDHIFTSPCSFIVFSRFWPGGQLQLLCHTSPEQTQSQEHVLPGEFYLGCNKRNPNAANNSATIRSEVKEQSTRLGDDS